jgi:hypothetical protein
MKITIESTEHIVMLNDVPARHWIGTTDRGVAVEAFIPLIGPVNDADRFAFDVEFEQRATITQMVPEADVMTPQQWADWNMKQMTDALGESKGGDE